MSVYTAEFVGTLLLILLGVGVNANVLLKRTKGHDSGWIVITTGWGLAVALAVYSVGRVSGAHINPAVTLGLASVGAFPWELVPGYMAAQMAGAWVGAGLAWLAYLPHWSATSDPGLKLGVFSTAPAVPSSASNFVCEVIGTAVLVFGVMAIGANASLLDGPGGIDLSVAFSSGFQPLLVGLLVFAIGLGLGGPTGFAINPARDLGPRLAHALLPIPGKGGSDWAYSWIPVLGPLAGGVLGALLFVLFDYR
ncbi:MAG TPA: MIP/aquaporin family protein [Acidobacteriota bacterium]|nr:MIP/aquaporin family protein [Acidobacteriota bacterium]